MLITMPTQAFAPSRREPRRERHAVRARISEHPVRERVLVIGNGPAGVWPRLGNDHELRIAFSERLAALRPLPCAVDLVCSPEMFMRKLRHEVSHALRLPYDGVLLDVGADDVRALTPPDEWEHALHALLRFITANLPHAEVVVMAAQLEQPAASGAVADPWPSHLHALRLNAVTRTVCAGFPRVLFSAREPFAVSSLDLVL